MKLTGKEYWRSLEQLAKTDKFNEFLHNEFPKGTVELAGNNNWSRRSFLTTMGASMALAGLIGCRRPVEKIVPYVTRPEEIDPGVPLKYATTMPLGLSAYGVVVTTHEGRPTFIEGNELHPSSKGAVNPLVQASLLDLYDPDRSKSVLRDGKKSSWDDFVAWWQEQYAKYKENGGAGLAILGETTNTLTLGRLWRDIEGAFGSALSGTSGSMTDQNVLAGLRGATGVHNLSSVYDFAKAKVVLSLDCDFLGTESESISATRGFSEARRVTSQSDEMNRLYVVEPSMTATGMMADHRKRMNGVATGQFSVRLYRELVEKRGTSSGDNWVAKVAHDLLDHKGECLIVAGRRQPPAVHSLVAELNQTLSNVGETISYVRPGGYHSPGSDDSLVDLMQQGEIETLILIGNNVRYEAPNSALARALDKVPNVVHLASHVDETSLIAKWHIPRTHYLEAWGDAVAADGTMSIVQPVIEPLHGAMSDVEFVNLLATGELGRGYDLVRETWTSVLRNVDFESNWAKVLHDGIYSERRSGAGNVNVTQERVRSAVADLEQLSIDDNQLEVALQVSAVFDGRYANNGWLQELPDPVTKLTWDNAALISAKLAKECDLENEDVVKLEVDGRSIEIPVWISPGQAENSISVALGYGRTAAGRVGNGVGVNAYTLRTSDSMWFASGVTITKTGRKQELACTQDHGSMEGRPIVRENTLAGYKEKAEFFPAELEHPPLMSLWDEHKYDEGYQWGMSIDLNACTGCNACVIGCQAENNIPVIGREEVRNGREMHWMRVDRYYAGDTNDPEVAIQPMNCQHCEMAPCEQVCPVAATSHDEEGLNVMVYNRCIGTRYCSNNCPYKVRRFNFFNYTNELPETVQMVQNPEVTVRSRGVMEKCTYCIQRIVAGKATAKHEGRTVTDGEIKTACESACPAQAIVFGNINDPKSRVSQLRENNRKYRVLEELNTRPRTTYLAKLRNPNPALASNTKPEDDSYHG